MLKPGTILGHYEILNLIGVGGMGEVYRAHDNKLKRDVALKLLPEVFARDPDRIARFRREAQVLAQLNHPNIAAIYNFEEIGGESFLVMELVLGDTLRERLAKSGPVPIEEALDIAEQISEALEAAHEKPIIHRDLKPANVKVTPQGLVKVLDFGLAKAYAGDAADIDPHDLPTGSLAGTLKGTILGTPAYMSPEQAKGKTADKRTDIWALGCVLYELLTGKWVFQSRDREGAVVTADTVQEIIAKVLEAEPDWAALPERTPPSIRTLLRRCLQKDLPRRLRDATDVRIEIEDAQAASTSTVRASVAPVLSRAISRRMTLVGFACLLAGGMVAGLAVWNLRQPTPRPVERVVVPLAAEERLPNSPSPVLALSPDGAQLAYKTARGIYVRAMDSFEARLLPGTEGANDLFFSPDGQWLGFFAFPGGLKKVSVSGGAVLTLTNIAGPPRGASWGPNDTLVFATAGTAGLSQVSAAGGEPQALTKLKAGEIGHRWPQFLPDGKSVFFTVQTGGNPDDWHIAAQRLDTAEHQILIRGGTYGRYVPTGHLVYYRAGTIMAVPFDPVRLEVMGTPAPVVEGVMAGIGIGPSGAAQFSFSSLGSLAYVPGSSLGQTEETLVWVDRKGAEEPLAAPPRAYDDPHLSPDGQQVALTEGATRDIWVYDIPRATLARLTFVGVAGAPLWTPDGKRIVFAFRKPGSAGLYWKPADGSGTEERLMTSEFLSSGSSVSPDGKTLAFHGRRPNTADDIWVLPLEGERKPQPFLQTPFNEGGPMFSPDGRWLAYQSNESGRDEIYVQPFPGPGGKYLISSEGGIAPVWARSGRELFYRNGDRMMAVDVDQSRDSNGAVASGFRAGTPRMLFERRGYQQDPVRADYDISPDGQRFLMLKAKDQPQTAAATQIHVVLNWFEELKRRVPVP